MTAEQIAQSFSSFCISAYECLQMYKIMCVYKINDNSGIWGKFGTILQHYWVLQVAKINDPIEYNKNYNYSLAYFVDYVNRVSYTDSYNKFLEYNKAFIEAIKDARVKVVAHRDLSVFNSPDGVGAFSTGLDDNYFNSLHEIISEGYRELGLGLFPEWPLFIVDDTKVFMDKIEKAFNAPKTT